MPRAALLLALALLAAGCAGPGPAPDDRLPGVRTETRVEDAFRCGALLFPQGCVIVRVERAESGCGPEVGGYVVCDAIVEWTATSGAVLPGSVLRTATNATAGPSCAPAPGTPCQVRGTERHEGHFERPGERHRWSLALHAVLDAPAGSGAAQADGEFLLRLTMDVWTEDEDELAD